jgi:hypothetical protein
MQKLTAVFLFCLLALGTNLSSSLAQTATSPMSQGSVQYAITKGSGQMKMLEGSTFTAFFKDGMSKIKGDLMGGIVGINMMFDEGKKEGLMLMDMMAQRKAVKLGKDDYNKIGPAGSSGGALKVVQTKSTKKIAGYTCKKVLLTNADGSKITAYVCDAIKPANSDMLKNLIGKDLGGFPLGFSFINDAGEELEITATKINSKIPEAKEFDMKIPSQYQITTIEELQKMAR